MLGDMGRLEGHVRARLVHHFIRGEEMMVSFATADLLLLLLELGQCVLAFVIGDVTLV